MKRPDLSLIALAVAGGTLWTAGAFAQEYGYTRVRPVVVVPVIREDRWGTTYYPGLPFGGLRNVQPTPLKARHYRGYRYGNVVSSRG